LIDGRMAEAVRYFTRAVQIAPGEPDVVIGLVEALFQNQQEQEAERVCAAVHRSKKSHGAAYDALYVHYLNTGRIADAEQILKLKIANNPERADLCEPALPVLLEAWKTGAVAGTNRQTACQNRDRLRRILWQGIFTSPSRIGTRRPGNFKKEYERRRSRGFYSKKRIANGLIAQGRKAQSGSLVERNFEAAAGR